MFASYAAIVKNLRGIALFDPNEDIHDIITWLVSRFKYRNIGISERLKGLSSQLIGAFLNANPFIVVDYPVSHLKNFPPLLSKALNVKDIIVEAICLSSIYVSPLLVLGENYINEIYSLLTDYINVEGPLDNRSWKLHLRIADYTILDFYNECVKEGFEAIELIRKGEFERLGHYIDSRVKRIINDKRRYWRIMKKEGRLFLGYIDNMKLLYDALENFKDVKLHDDYAAFLGIIPVVFIHRDLIKK